MRPIKLSKLGIHFAFRGDEIIWLWRKQDGKRWHSVCFTKTFATKNAIPDVTSTKRSYIISLVIKYGGVYFPMQDIGQDVMMPNDMMTPTELETLEKHGKAIYPTTGIWKSSEDSNRE